MSHRFKFLLLLCLASVLLAFPALGDDGDKGHHSHMDWTLIADDPGWSPRAGLQVVQHRNNFYLMGGRTPLDPAIVPVFGASTMYSDVWKSMDRGETWDLVKETEDPDSWPARAYFQAVTMKGRIFVLGGQNFKLVPNPDPENGPPFFPDSDFFNDVWSSLDGEHWELMTAEAPWHGRAGLSAVVFRNEIYVLGGSFNDDPAIIGGPPERVYFNDVWKSSDGVTWEEVTDAAPWAPRAGGIAIVKGSYLYMIGGEDGFICIPGFRCPPYYNDVWRTLDGANWELVTAEAPWAPRPGHQVVVMNHKFVLFGGFGLSQDPTDPFAPSNPMDMWSSWDGENWELMEDVPWNAADPAEIKYDFDALVARGGGPGWRESIYTFGGDRETFNPVDPENWKQVDDDVWRFGPRAGRKSSGNEAVTRAPVRDLRAAPNPFNPQVGIMFTLDRSERVSLEIYDVAGRLVRTLRRGTVLDSGEHQIFWNGRDEAGLPSSAGVYFYRLQAGDFRETSRIMMVK